MELQETSCHTAEASRVDSIFNRAFESQSGHGCLNDFPLHSLTPLTKIPAVGYSETRNVLTGVIDSPDTLIVVKDYFLKTILYLMIEEQYNNCDQPSKGLYRSSSTRSRLGSGDLKNRKVYSTLPKMDKPLSASRMSLSTPRLSREGSASNQSGRGSRMAWVSDHRVNGLSHVRESSLSEDLRPVSVQEDIPDKKTTTNSGSFPSKAKSYLTSIEHISEETLLAHKTSDLQSSPESDSESTRDFFTKSWPKHPKDDLPTARSTTTPHTDRSHNLHRSRSWKLGKHSSKMIYNCSLSASLSPPSNWLRDLPFTDEELEDIQDTFPLSWFKFILKQFGLLKVQQPLSFVEENTQFRDRLVNKLLEDDVLEENYRYIHLFFILFH